MEDAVRQAKEDAEKAALSKSKFLAAASHDLRQPMQALLLFAGTLENHVHDERGRASLRHLQRGLDALKDLLDSLLDVSRLDAGVIQPVMREFPIAEVLDEVDASYAAVCRGMGLDWRVAPCGVTIRSDPTLLRRVLRNLIENAVRFTRDGFIHVECRCDDRHLRIAVRDSGIGIPADEIERIFDEFHQIGNSERDRQQGLGLGLAIVRRIADLLGFQVTVASEPGRGTVFAFEVPLGDAQPVISSDVPRAVPGDCDRFALVIDDDAMVLMALETMLRTWGYEVLASGSADEALDRLRDIGRSPDLLVADYRLRDGSVGTEAVLRIRERFGRDIPGILLTGELGPECQRDAAAHGLHVVYKPVTPRQLSQVLEERTKVPC
ncbi:hypothetical protein TSO221_15715 [Azospirillum sp. TSO22-1]|nr:hypothetical protein TSO221_15715 [Azospirillum sp. TSO22-1]